ncbi:MAG TPA: carboxypeptidase regulatory-like domain-containing protein [Kofleriaceae bacterium]|nr:carboxypeptidase regulatory-like domain-containing protein [Kofleriaceae bacterium]
MKRWYLLAGAAALVAAVIGLYVWRGRGHGGGAHAADGDGAGGGPAGPPRKQVEMAHTAGGDGPQVLADDDPPGTLTLEGQVVSGPGNDPVGGALVVLDSHPPRSVRSEADGSFEFTGLVARPYDVAARAPTGIAGPVSVRLTGATEPVILHLAAAPSVEVTVVAVSDRRPIAGATVELRGTAEDRAVTDGEGKATFAQVVPDNYAVVASAPGHARASAWIQVPSGDVTATTTLALRAGAPVSGRVLAPDGGPAPGARVVFSGVSDWSQQADPRHDAVVTDGEGRFRFEALPAGTFRFTARHDQHAPGVSDLVTLDGQTEKREVIIRLEVGAVLSGLVKSNDGKPVASARVRAAVKTTGFDWVPPRQTFTDGDGKFSLAALPRRVVEAAATGDAASSKNTDVDLTGGDQQVTLVLDLTASIAGTVVDTKGEPVEGAQVTAWESPGAAGNGRRPRPPGGGFNRLSDGHQELTDAGGRFELHGLDDDTVYALRAAPPGATGEGRMFLRDPVEAKSGTRDVKITLPADGGVKGVVAYDDGSAPGMFTVSVGFRSSTPFASKDGSFHLGDLPPRTYSVTVAGPGFQTRTVPNVVVKDGEVADVGTITVVKGRVISGRVTAGGAPVAGATVQAGRRLFGSGSSSKAAFNPFGGEGVKETTTDDAGSFTLMGVGTGDLSLVAEHETQGRSLTLAIRGTRESVHDLELQLQPFGALEGVVTSAGKPVEGVRIGAQSQSAPGAVFGVATGSDGKFRYDRLAPDTYKVSVVTGGMMSQMGFHSRVVTVQSGQTAKLTLEVTEGAIALTVQPKADKPTGFAIVNAVRGAIAVHSARELEAAIAAMGEGFSALSMSIRGNPARLENLQPGDYTVCVTPYPTEVSGMSDIMGYMQREGDNLKVFCEKTTVAADPTEQTTVIEVELPAFVPPGS